VTCGATASKPVELSAEATKATNARLRRPISGRYFLRVTRSPKGSDSFVAGHDGAPVPPPVTLDPPGDGATPPCCCEGAPPPPPPHGLPPPPPPCGDGAPNAGGAPHGSPPARSQDFTDLRHRVIG